MVKVNICLIIFAFMNSCMEFSQAKRGTLLPHGLRQLQNTGWRNTGVECLHPAIGKDIKIEVTKGVITGIFMGCNENSEIVDSGVGYLSFNVGYDKKKCGGKGNNLVGYKLRALAGIVRQITFFCSNGKELKFGQTTTRDIVSGKKECPTGQFLCGMKVIMDQFITGIGAPKLSLFKNIIFFCCTK